MEDRRSDFTGVGGRRGRSFPSGLTVPTGITSHGGALYVVDDGTGTANELWRIDDPTSPGSAVDVGDHFHPGLTVPTGITSHGGALYVVDDGTVDELWRIDDPTAPGSAVEGAISIRARGPERHHVDWSRTLHDPRGARDNGN